MKALPAKHGAVLRGKVTIKGAPDIAAENAELADEISKKPDQKPACYDMAPDAERSQQKWVLDGKGGVGNVVVWIQPPANDYFQVDPNDKTWPDQVELNTAALRLHPARHLGWCRRWWTPTTPPRRSRPARSSSCRTPRPCRTTRRGIRRTATNSSWGRCRRARRRRRSTLKGNNALVHFSCNIHPWMDAYVWVFNHPYADVTKTDGTYEIKNVPAGSKVRITAWHEMGPKAFSHYLTANKSKGDEIDAEGGRDRPGLHAGGGREVSSVHFSARHSRNTRTPWAMSRTRAS